MKTLYININGEDIQSTDELIVVGGPQTAIIDKFYYELGKEILRGVPGSIGIKRKGIVLEFRDANESAFKKILEQWNSLKKRLLGDNPAGEFEVELPMEYISWLSNHTNQIYSQVASSIRDRAYKVTISIDALYRNSIGILINSIDPDEYLDCEQFVVNDELITEESKMVIDFECSLNQKIDFKSYKDCQDEYTFTKGEQFGEYDEILLFHEGRACVRRNGKYGYIDKFGKEVIECKYDLADSFQEGLAFVIEEHKRKFINKEGHVVFEVDDDLELYGDNCGFSEGLCKVGNKIDEDCDDDSPIFGFIDRTGKLVIACQFENASNFHDGRALVWDDGDGDDYENRNINFRYIDTEGKEVIGCYDGATEFRNGYAAVQIKTLPIRRGNYKTRIIDVDGNNVYKLDMHDSLRANVFSDWRHNSGLNNSVFRYSYHEWIDLDTGKKYTYSHNGFISACGFFEGFAAVQDEQGKWGFINIAGDIVINCQFNNDNPMFSNGLACVEQNGLWGYVDNKGKVVIPYQYTQASIFSEDRAVVRRDNILMVIDKEGNPIVIN